MKKSNFVVLCGAALLAGVASLNAGGAPVVDPLAVPEGGATFALLFVAVIAVVALHRRFAR